MPRTRTTRATAIATTRDGDAAVKAVIGSIRRLDRGLRLAARMVEREAGLSAAQLFVLEQLRGAEPLSLNDLARRTFTDRSSVSGVVDRLVDGRLVTRLTSAADRRRAEVRLTHQGRAVLDRAPSPPTHLLIDALHRMPRASVRSLASALGQLNAELGFRDASMLFEER